MILSYLTGVLALIIWIAAGLRQDLHEVFPALLLSTLAYYVLSRAETLPEAAARP